MLPNFLVIGAPRSGTTSLYEYLNAHPEIYMSPVKEPDFFCQRSLDAVYLPNLGGACTPEEGARRETALQADREQYEALFQEAGNAKRRGEASAIYLGHPTAAAHIRRLLPDVKLIAVLRDPVERAYSHYVHAQRIYGDFGSGEEGYRRTEEEFTRAVDRTYRTGVSEPASTDPEVWVRSGFYFEHLTRFRALFPEEQLRVFLFEDLTADTRATMAEIYRFLDVDNTFVLPTTAAFNASVVPRNAGLFRYFTRRNPVVRLARSLVPAGVRGAALQMRDRTLGGGKPAMDPELHRKLAAIYREDTVKLQNLLGRDLSAWLDTAPGS